MGRKQTGVRPRGKGIQIDFYFHGQRCLESLRIPPTTANLKHAARLRETVLYEIATNTFDYAKHFPNSKRLAQLGNPCIPTVKQQLTKWLNSKYNTGELSTYRSYNSAVTHHLIPQFGEKLLTELSTGDIREWRDGLTVSNKMANNVLIPLRGILADAHADGLIERNPMDRIKNLTHRTREPEPFTPDEVTAILKYCDGQVRNLFEFAFWTGLRTSELIALEWGDIDWLKGCVYVRRASVAKKTKPTKTKSGERSVKLLPPAVEALKAQKKHTRLQGNRVFQNPFTGDSWIDDQQIRKTAWKPTLLRAGVAYRTPYQTRHTYASMMLMAGETPMWTAQQLGHANCSTIYRAYARWIPDVGGSGGDKIMAIWSQDGHKEELSD
jgi:integrase